jgi:hypothetical protein
MQWRGCQGSDGQTLDIGIPGCRRNKTLGEEDTGGRYCPWRGQRDSLPERNTEVVGYIGGSARFCTTGLEATVVFF